MPDQPWTVFDSEGFSAYRIVMIVMACCSLSAVFGVARLFLDEQWAFLAYLVTVTTPFVVHETYFTWPKLEAASLVLLASYLIVRRRFLLAGLFWESVIFATRSCCFRRQPCWLSRFSPNRSSYLPEPPPSPKSKLGAFAPRPSLPALVSVSRFGCSPIFTPSTRPHSSTTSLKRIAPSPPWPIGFNRAGTPSPTPCSR